MVRVNKRYSFVLALPSVIFGAGLIGVGCSARTNPALERARTMYMQASQDPEVAANAPVALHDAEAVLNQAEHTWESTKDQKEVEHLVYLTEKRIEIARAVAQRREAEAEAQRLNDEREQVIIEARTHEAERARQEAAQAAARAKQLEQELADLKAQQTERGLVLTLGDVLFEYDKAELKAGALRNLYQLVTFLKENPARNVLIEGHTDNIGSESYNLDLSRRRAEAVEAFLLQNSISPERVIARGYGEAYPVASNDTEAGRQQNRRVEVVILNEGERAIDKMR